jgi:hypothetical protein
MPALDKIVDHTTAQWARTVQSYEGYQILKDVWLQLAQ